MLYSFKRKILLATHETQSFPVHRNVQIMVCPLLLKNSTFRVHFTLFILTLLIRVGTLCSAVTVYFLEVPPLTSIALLTTLYPLLENVLQTVYHSEISCLGVPFSWLETPRNRIRRDLDCMADVLMGFHRSNLSNPNTEFNSDLAPCDFWAFPIMKR
jgi:hypothetical protein